MSAHERFNFETLADIKNKASELGLGIGFDENLEVWVYNSMTIPTSSEQR